MATLKTTDEIRGILSNATLDFELTVNKALNHYLPKIFHSCPFTEEVCTTKQCIECKVFNSRKRSVKWSALTLQDINGLVDPMGFEPLTFSLEGWHTRITWYIQHFLTLQIPYRLLRISAYFLTQDSSQGHQRKICYGHLSWGSI